MSYGNQGIKYEDDYDQLFNYKYKKVGELYFYHYNESGNIYLVQSGTDNFDPCNFYTWIGQADDHYVFCFKVSAYLKELAESVPECEYLNH